MCLKRGKWRNLSIFKLYFSTPFFKKGLGQLAKPFFNLASNMASELAFQVIYSSLVTVAAFLTLTELYICLYLKTIFNIQYTIYKG